MAALVDLLILLVAARLCGEIAERLGLTSSVGELSAGIALAVLADLFFVNFELLAPILRSDGPSQAATIGIFFLVLSAGIELRPQEITRRSGAGILIAAGGIIVPLAAGTGLMWLFLPDSPARPILSLLVGTTLSVTALPATVKVLAELNRLHTVPGRLIVSAAVFDDVIGLFLLALLIAFVETGGTPDLLQIAVMLGKVVAFFAATVLLGAHVYPHISRHMGTMKAAAFELSALIAVAVTYGLLAEALDMHWILGAFVAGLFFEPARVGVEAYHSIKLIVSALTVGIAGPLFFAEIGLRVDIGAVLSVPLFITLLCVVAVLSKLIGAGLPALWSGLDRHEALEVALGMTARGGVGIIVVGIAAELGVFDLVGSDSPVVENLYSSLILMTVITTMAAPLALRWINRRTTGRVDQGAG